MIFLTRTNSIRSITSSNLIRSIPSISRPFSSSPLLSQSLESPTYPGLYYHSLPSPPFPHNSYSLSFLPTPPPSLSFSPTTIGILEPKDPTHEDIPQLIPRNFNENGDFKQLLHDVLREAVKGDLWIETMAKGRVEGYIHIPDERNPSDPNRVPDPNDIIASLLVQDGLVTDQYEEGALHRLVTMHGMMRLNKGLMDRLREACEKVREVEIEIEMSKEKEEST